jgi:hypothetical protein
MIKNRSGIGGHARLGAKRDSPAKVGVGENLGVEVSAMRRQEGLPRLSLYAARAPNCVTAHQRYRLAAERVSRPNETSACAVI